MALDLMRQVEIIEVMESYLLNSRPAEELREAIDLNYKVVAQSVIIVEIRPVWDNPSKKMESNIAKATFIKKENKWSIYWFRSDMKWHSYTPKPKVNSLKDFIKEIEEDTNGCFWG